jgi:hypothetical protein
MPPNQPILFVHYTHPDDAKDSEIQTEVRRHVMENHSRATRPPRRGYRVVEMEMLPLPPSADPSRALRSAAPPAWGIDEEGLGLAHFGMPAVPFLYYCSDGEKSKCSGPWLMSGWGFWLGVSSLGRGTILLPSIPPLLERASTCRSGDHAS